jgi:DNA-binding MarR family transcriptional regulator
VENTASPTTCHHLVDRESRLPRPPADPLLARLDHAILSLGALAARPRFHTESRARAGLGREFFPNHPARRVDPALYGVLAALAGEGMPGPSSIAVRLGLSPSTVSHHLATLQRRGLVERRPYFGHRKWRDVELTPLGKDAYETLRDARHELLATLLDQWTPDERRSVVNAVAKLGDAVRMRNLDAHERSLAKAREAALDRTPEQIEKARRYQRERYARSRSGR